MPNKASTGRDEPHAGHRPAPLDSALNNGEHKTLCYSNNEGKVS
jgi:hypothetical protein